MRRNPAPCRIYKLAGSFKSGKSADCIIATNDGPHSCAVIPIDWGLFLFELAPRSLFMSQEALEREIAEMRQQIAELKAEAERADSENKEAGRS